MFHPRNGKPITKCSYCGFNDTQSYCMKVCDLSIAQFMNESGEYICGKSFCVDCSLKRNSESHTVCPDCNQDEITQSNDTPASSTMEYTLETAASSTIKHTLESLKKMKLAEIKALCKTWSVKPK